MKTKIRQISKRSISILLSLMMFVTSFAGFGVLDVIAATVQSDSVGAESIYITYVPNTNDYINYWWFDGVNKKQMTNTSGTTYSYTFPTSGASLDANTTYRFQIMWGSEHYVGNYTSVVDGQGYQLYSYGTNNSHHSVNYATGNKSTITVTFDTESKKIKFSSSSVEKYYVVGSAVNNDTSWSTFTELPGSSGTYTKSFANATELASGKDFIVTSAKSTSNNVKSKVSNGTGISFTGGGDSNIQFSFSSNYTYPVTLTYTKSSNTLTGTATSNVKPVASSVALSATPNTVETNNPIDLTAALSDKASGLGDVTYTFTKTSGGNGTFKDNKSTVTTSDTTATATFTPTEAGTYTFKVVASATGYTSVENTVTVNVTAPEKYYIVGDAVGGWGDINYIELEGSNGTYSHTFNSASDLKQDSNFLIVNTKDTGDSAQVKPTATNGNGITFSKINNDYKFTLDANYTYPVTLTLTKSGSTYTLTGTATYQAPKYTSTVKSQTTADGTAWENQTGSASHAKFADGTTSATVDGATGINVTAEKVDGYQFSSWVVSNGSVTSATSATTTFKPTANNATVTARYKKEHTITCNPATNGGITATKTTVLAGDNYTINIAPDTGYTLDTLTINGTVVAVTGATYTAQATGNVTAEATFKEISDVYYYVAVDTSWTADPKLGTGITKVAEISSSTKLYNGTTELRSGKTYKVWLVRSEEGKTVTIGEPGTDSSNYGMNVVPQSGYCYSYGSSGSNNNFVDTINAATITLKATSTDANNLKNKPVNLSFTTSTNNKTAGQDTVNVTYTVKAPDGSNVTVTNNQFTPTVGGTYQITATAVDNNSGNISLKPTSVATIKILDEVPTYKVIFGSSNDTMGTVAATAGGSAINSGATVVSGTQVTFTATNKNTSSYEFLGWYDNPEGTGTKLFNGSTSTSQNYTVTSNTTVYAVFGGKTSNYRLVKKSGDSYTSLGNFRATETADKYVLTLNFNEGEEFSFYVDANNNNSPESNTDYFAGVSLGDEGTGITMYQYGNNFAYPTFKANATGTYVFTWKKGSGNDGSLSVVRPSSSTATVYAKDGTIRNYTNNDGSVTSYQKYADMADTKLISGVTDIDSSPTYYEKAKAKKGGTITIQTTIATEYRNDYYVKAFCINGDSYGVITKSEAEAHKSDGVYTCTYAIPDADNFTGNTIEITPIYYYFDDEDTVTFYVEGRTEELADVAGDTLSVYAFYQGGADATVAFNAKNMQAFGGYPGQPLVKDGGRFYMQVPKHLNGNTSRPISGITLSNYVWDDIHSLRVENGTGNNRNNIQTYDYNCFLRINDVKKARDIFFEFKYRNGGNNKIADIGGKITDENVSCLKNGWEDLTNHLGGLVDIYNDNISGSTDGKEPLHVVSNGYIDNGSQTYATEWNVYAPASEGGNLIGVISPTALLAENADGIIYGSKIDTYKATYNALEKYKGYPVRITYEKAMWNDEGKADGGSQGGEKALRIDGRWTYITNDDFAEGKVEIQYANTLNDEFVTDSFTEGTNQGSQTGTKAYFTNEDFYHETSSGSIRVNPDEYFTFAAETDPDNQYMFVGWWKRSVDGTYVPMTEARSHMVGNDTFVARFIKTPDGNLSVKHQLYNSDSPVVENMPQIYGGQGNCYVKVEIMDGDTVIATFGNTTSATSVSVDQKYIRADSTYKMRITLTTVMKGKNTFEDIYRRTERIPAYTSVKTAESDEDGISTVISGNVATTVRYYPIDRLFKDSDGNLQDVQIVKTANYYSNIKTVNKDFKITYYFYDRFGTEQKYVVKGGLPEGQNALEEQDLIDNAPYEKNFIKDFAWNFNKTGDNCYQIYEQDGVSTAVVHSDQPTKKVYVSYSSSFKTEGAYDKILEFEYGSLVTVDGKKLNAPETNPENDKEKFSHWEICNDDGDFVTNVYSRWFNYVLYDNYLIKPIYKETPDSITTSGISATIQFLEYSRNQWTDDNGNMAADGSSDRIFADFALAFTKNGELIKPADNECGIVLAVGPNLDTFGNTNLADIEFSTDDVKLKDFILNGTAYESDGANGTVKAVKSSIVKDLDNKNRVELYNRFKNSPANTDPVIKAYSYIIVDGEVTLSKPVYISLKDESIKTYTHSVG